MTPLSQLFSRWLLAIPIALMLHGGAHGETVARYGIRGAVVAQLTPQQLDLMFEAIGELEAACARHAAIRLSASERDILCRLHAQARAAMRAADSDLYDRLNQ
ncbi:MAG: DNA-binding GntR family transcriptional regulator [Janthinobacterium sp.]|jgi:DNA-binding GntR family transcriptional regulator